MSSLTCFRTCVRETVTHTRLRGVAGLRQSLSSPLISILRSRRPSSSCSSRRYRSPRTARRGASRRARGGSTARRRAPVRARHGGTAATATPVEETARAAARSPVPQDTRPHELVLLVEEGLARRVERRIVRITLL